MQLTFTAAPMKNPSIPTSANTTYLCYTSIMPVLKPTTTVSPRSKNRSIKVSWEILLLYSLPYINPRRVVPGIVQTL
jgi:hypothetical protein